MDSYIAAIGTATPEHKISQGQIANFMVKAHQLGRQEEDRLKVLYRATGIRQRYSVLEDYGMDTGFVFFPETEGLEPFPDTAARMGLYREHALSLSMAAIADCRPGGQPIDYGAVTHLVTVSCTGMYAPGLDIDLVNALGIRGHVQRTCINFMGCYAAFNAMKMADTICKAHPQASVLVVCTELCSIHFQKEKTDDNLLANAIFADGSAALLVQGRPPAGLSLAMGHFHCALATEGAQDMAWGIGNFGFEMRLSAYVPDIIRRGIRQLIDDLLAAVGDQGLSTDYYAIHPGGKRILEVIENALGIGKELNQAARAVLQAYGNMSSPTILFVLNHLKNLLTPRDVGKNILGLAFGPGLTLESMLLKAYFKA